MSNYPPGVTGNEPQIAGLNEGVEQRTCVRSGDRTLVSPYTLELRDNLIACQNDYEEGRISEGQYIIRMTSIVRMIDFEKRWDSIVEDHQCTFSGEVDVEFDRYLLYWECPQCGEQYEEEIDMEPDWEWIEEARKDRMEDEA